VEVRGCKVLRRPFKVSLVDEGNVEREGINELKGVNSAPLEYPEGRVSLYSGSP